ncbi:MAG: molybdopterin-dependent oxidoreductase [Actinomycetota bacterium]
MSRYTPEEFAARERQLAETTDAGEEIPVGDHEQRSRRAFLSFAGLGTLGLMGFGWLQNRPEDEAIPDLLRAGLDFNESVWTRIERDGAMARTFSISDREDIRVNGRHGLRDANRDMIQVGDDEAVSWQIELTSTDGSALDPIPLRSIRNDFEVHDMVWEHKCVEGWSNIVHWTGVRFADVLAAHAPEQASAEWMVLRTPTETDEGRVERVYSSAIENYTMLHPQTLFAWRLNGEELTAGHGSPIRIVTPLKYGIKQLKSIGSIEFTNDRPTDYWTERGYDLHAGF